jgi:hypothetical protein
MNQRTASPLWWVVLAVGVAAVLGLGLTLMPRLLAATTYVPPTPTATAVPPTAEPRTATPAAPEQEPTAEPPTAIPTSALQEAPEFSLPGGSGVTVSLADELDDGPVVVVFFARVGG